VKSPSSIVQSLDNTLGDSKTTGHFRTPSALASIWPSVTPDAIRSHTTNIRDKSRLDGAPDIQIRHVLLDKANRHTSIYHDMLMRQLGGHAGIDKCLALALQQLNFRRKVSCGANRPGVWFLGDCQPEHDCGGSEGEEMSKNATGLLILIVVSIVFTLWRTRRKMKNKDRLPRP